MTDFTLNAEKRENLGANAAKRLRSQGFVPSIMYARGEAAIPLTVSYKDFVKAAQSARISQVFMFKSNDGSINGRSAIVKEIQKDGLAGKVLHVDFQALHENEEIVVRIPLNITGEAIGVKLDGGILTVSAHELSVSCLPKAIPQSIDVNVSELKIGQSVHAENIALPQGVRLSGNPLETIVSVVAVRQVVEETTTAAPGAEGAAAAGAEGAAAGADAAASADAAKAGGDDKAAKPAKGKEK
ncbi:MAG: 50S ribosomal protein L25 [Deltaproteobacteria bacterium]|nr:50S ribosomal protein L25 [Deltaproteobacteria bacterium]